MASGERRLRVLDALGRLLDPIVLLLLKSGITFREFSDLARTKFVQVATREFGIRGRPTNASRVAILTGLDRREVRKVRLADEVPGVPESGYMSKPTQVLDGWFHDPVFLDAHGQPLELAVDDGEASFAALVRRYAPGIPPVAMIKELRSAAAVEQLANGKLRVLKRHYIPRELSANQIRLWGSILEDLGTTLEHNLMRERTEAPRFERRAISLTIERKSLAEFEAFLAEQGQGFLERIDDWLAAHQADPATSERGTALRLGVGVYQILDRPQTQRSESRGSASAPGTGEEQ
jgi:hypothetical protein